MEKFTNPKADAPFFEMSNTATPDPKMSVTVGNEYVKNPGSSAVAGGNFKAYRTNQRVPHPNNSAAMRTDHGKVMGQVLKGK